MFHRLRRGNAHHLTMTRCGPLLLGLTGLVLAGCGSAQAASTQASTLKAQIAHDKAFVAARYHHCKSLHLSPPHCPFKIATTSNGHGGSLIAIDLTQQTGDDCNRGRVFFFNKEHFLASTRKLRPHSLGGVVGLHAKGAKKFTVTYAVSKTANTSCAEAGNAGTDSYVYAYNGHQMFKKSGTPPKLPKVIVGT